MRNLKLNQFSKINQLPVQHQQKNNTDIFCLIIAVVFTLTMIITAFITYNQQKYMKSNFPADSQGSLCGIDLLDFPYLYFGNLPQINQRVCVKECPKKQDKKLNCHPTDDISCRISQNDRFSVKFYQSQAQQTRDGFFCWPINKKIQQIIYQKTNLDSRNMFYNSLDTIKVSALIALGCSIIYFILVQFLPKIMNFSVSIIGIIILIAIIICVFLYQTNFTKTKMIFGILLIFLLILSGFTVFKHWHSVSLHAIYLKWSTKMFLDRIQAFIYIILFSALFAIHVLIIVLEFKSFWTVGNIHFDPQHSIYHELEGTLPTILTVFLSIQLIFGLTFIKQAFNFCISGNAIHWFFEQRSDVELGSSRVKKNAFYPAYQMITKHLGTVMASSFMNNGFFLILDWLFDILKPINQNQDSFYNKIFKYTCSCCVKILDLVRSDSLAYVNLTGNPYCNSARYCQMLCRNSQSVQYSQSSSRVYRLNAHLLLMGIVGLSALYIKGNISIYAEIIIFIEALFISTLFISFHADSAEAIQIAFLTFQEIFFRQNQQKPNKISRQNLSQLIKENIRSELIKQISQQRKNRKKINDNEIINKYI